MHEEAVLRAYVGACRAQVRVFRPYSPEWERALERLEDAEINLDRFVTHNSRVAVNHPAVA